MDKTRAFVALTVFTLFVFSATMNYSLAASYDSVGVLPGATATYDIAQRSTLGGYKYEYTATITVENVEGTIVTLRIREFLPNGTLSYEWLMTGDVATGKLMPYLIAADLAGGDPVFSGASARINWTIQIQIAGSNRNANYLAMAISTYSGWSEEYWDQETGLLLIGDYFNNFCSTWSNWTLTSTSLFAGQGPSAEAAAAAPYLFAGAIGVVALVVFAAIVGDRRIK